MDVTDLEQRIQAQEVLAAEARRNASLSRSKQAANQYEAKARSHERIRNGLISMRPQK